MNKLVTVIVPAYNEERHIEECLASIKTQTHPSIELIVVDDGSTDNTKKIAKKYADVFLEQKHQGPGVARNKGAKVAKGGVLVFVDADMYLDKNYVKNIIKPIVESKAVATFTEREHVANLENVWSKCFMIDNNLLEGSRVPKNSLPVSTVSRAIKKDFFLKRGGYNSSLGYADDHFFSQKEKLRAVEAKDVICYHYNPSTLKEVFVSARWVGRSIQGNANSFLKYSIINSLRISFKKISNGAPRLFLFYKLAFDFGIFSGMLNKNAKQNYSK